MWLGPHARHLRRIQSIVPGPPNLNKSFIALASTVSPLSKPLSDDRWLPIVEVRCKTILVELSGAFQL